MDVITSATGFPPPGAAKNAGDLKIRPGGGAYFSSKTFLGLGCQVRPIATIGNDPYTTSILEKIGADISAVKVLKNQQTPWSVVSVDGDGTARYLLHSGIDQDIDNSQLEQSLDDFCPDVVYIANANQLLQNPKSPIPSWLETAKRSKEFQVVVDMSKDLSTAHLIWRIAPWTDYLIGNQYELAEATGVYSLGDIQRECLQKKVRQAVIVKLGQFGSYFGSTTGDSQWSIAPGYTRAQIASEIGAGDVFSAVVTYLLLQNYHPQEALDTANFIAACHVGEIFDIHQAPDLKNVIQTKDPAQFLRSVTYSPSKNLLQFPEFTNRSVAEFDSHRTLSPEVMKRWINLIKEYGRVSHNSYLIDAGCGPGRFTFPIASHLLCKVLGIDVDNDAIELANSKCKDYRDCNCLVADLANPPPSLSHLTGKADCVWMSSVIQEVDSEAVGPIFSTANRWLVKGGRLLIRFTPKHLVDSMQWSVFIPEAKRYASQRYKSLSIVLDFLIDSGFEILDVRLIRDEQKVGSVEELLQRWSRGGFVWSHHIHEGSVAEIRNRMKERYGGGEIDCWDENYFIVCEKKKEYLH